MTTYKPWFNEKDVYLGLLGTDDTDYFVSTGPISEGSFWEDEYPETVFWAGKGNDEIESYWETSFLYGEQGDDTITTSNQNKTAVLVGGSGNDTITASGQTCYVVTSDPANPITGNYYLNPNEKDKIIIDLTKADKESCHYVFDYKNNQDQLVIKGQDIKKDLVKIEYGLSRLAIPTAILSFKNGAQVLLNFAEKSKAFSQVMTQIKDAVSYTEKSWLGKLDKLKGFAQQMGSLIGNAVTTKLNLTDSKGKEHQFKLTPTIY